MHQLKDQVEHAPAPAPADATEHDDLIAATDNSSTPGELEVDQDPAVVIASDTDHPAEVLT